jgi:tripartite-type tricarboxylate transporter receptor subunit TctC
MKIRYGHEGRHGPRAAALIGPQILAVLLLQASALPARAQDAVQYPGKAVRWLIPFAAGGPVDLLTRAIGEKLAQRWNHPVVMENRPGAGGTIGTSLAAKAPPDGHTLMTGHVGTHAINATLYPKLPYDPVKDFTPISLVAYMPFAVLVHPSVPAKNIKELIALAKARPGQINYASAGNGGPTHLIPEYFKTAARVNIVHVSYKGNAAALTDLMSGEVQLMFSNFLTSLPFVHSGKLRVIAISSAKRWLRMPDLPTMSESGLPGFHATAWYGMLAPANVPAGILQRLNADAAAVLAAPDMRERFVPQGIDLTTSTPAEFAELIRSEIPKWREIVRAAGATPG